MKKVCENEKCKCNCDCCKDGCNCTTKDCKCCEEGCKGDCDCMCGKDCKCGKDCDCGCGCGCKNINWMKYHHNMSNSGGGAVYGIGMIGAAIYFFSTSTSFWMVLLAILKAIVWPALLVFEAFKALLG